MPEEDLWSAVGEALDGHGWQWRAVAAERLADAAARVTHAVEVGDLPHDYAVELIEAARVELPPEVSSARSLVVGALPRPVTQAALTIDGVERLVAVPPHYAGYHELPRRFTALVGEALAPYDVAQATAPLKTVAAGAGLARYGRNNIAYVEGLGSYLLLAVCVTDVPPPADAAWRYPEHLELCGTCTACHRACPTGAIDDRRFFLHTGRCLTWHNESAEPMPAWIRPEWHTCAVGCLRCQQVCPENARVTLRVAEPERFNEDETAAILRGDDGPSLSEETRAKLAACGLDYSPRLIARNLRLLLALPPSEDQRQRRH